MMRHILDATDELVRVHRLPWDTSRRIVAAWWSRERPCAFEQLVTRATDGGNAGAALVRMELDRIEGAR